MSSGTSKMEEVINKPDDQFEGTLIDLIDYQKETSEKEALIKELYQNETSNSHHIKPAASINSSTYSSAASSSSSSSSSSTNSASSTSSTLSSPSQSNLAASKLSNDRDKDNSNPNKANGNELEEIEMALMEDLGKTANIVEHRSADVTTSRYLKNLVPAQTFHFHDPRIQYRTSMDTVKVRSTTNNLTSSKNLGPRKKRPVEQPILSQHIPGYKGEQEVDWLVNFIESGANNHQATNKKNSNANTNTNKRAKSQTKKSTQSDNERDIQQSRKSSNCVNTSTSGDSTSSSSSSSSSSTASSSGGSANGSNNMSEGKLAPSNHQRLMQNITNKPMPSGQTAAQSQSSQRKSQPSTANNQKQINNHVTNNSANTKPSKPPRVYKETSLSSSTSKSNIEPVPNKHSQENTVKQSIKEPHNAVTFADHIKLGDDDDATAQYTFGFFEEQQPNKLIETSRNSDQRRYEFKDNIDANSFNYKQILEFISKSWKQTVNVSMNKSN